VVVFAILWLPIHLFLLFIYFVDSSGPQDVLAAVFVLCTGLAYFNSCVNPIIYNRTSKDFRDAFRSAVGCPKRVRVDGDAATPLQPGRTAAAGITAVDGTNLAAEDPQCVDGKIQLEN